MLSQRDALIGERLICSDPLLPSDLTSFGLSLDWLFNEIDVSDGEDDSDRPDVGLLGLGGLIDESQGRKRSILRRTSLNAMRCMNGWHCCVLWSDGSEMSEMSERCDVVVRYGSSGRQVNCS